MKVGEDFVGLPTPQKLNNFFGDLLVEKSRGTCASKAASSRGYRHGTWGAQSGSSAQEGGHGIGSDILEDTGGSLKTKERGVRIVIW